MSPKISLAGASTYDAIFISTSNSSLAILTTRVYLVNPTGADRHDGAGEAEGGEDGR